MALTFEVSFLKAIQLLHSPDKNATDQLKSMLDECLAQKKTPVVAPVLKPPTSVVKPVISNRTAASVPTPVAAPILVPSDDIERTSLSCTVCKRFDQSTGNEIVECQECHSLYHQECHKPSLANENVKDPRFVWYCFACTNKRKKVKLPAKAPTVQSAAGSTNKDSAKETQGSDISPFKSWSFLKK